MGKSNALFQFIQDAKVAGKSHAEIREVLVSSGWPEEKVTQCLNHYSDVDFPVAVPKPIPYATPRLFFAHLFYFFLLYVSVFNFLDMSFSIINHFLPDDFEQRQYEQKWIMHSIRYNFSALVVAIPLLWVINKRIRHWLKRPEVVVPRIRLILIHFTLFVGASCLLSSGIYLLSQLLGGTLPLPLILKIALSSFTLLLFYRYYAVELKSEEKSSF